MSTLASSNSFNTTLAEALNKKIGLYELFQIVEALPALPARSEHILLATLPGDVHRLGTRITQALLEKAGCRVDVHWEMTPQALTLYLANNNPTHIVMTCFLTAQLDFFGALVPQLVQTQTCLVLGGFAFSPRTLSTRFSTLAPKTVHPKNGVEAAGFILQAWPLPWVSSLTFSPDLDTDRSKKCAPVAVQTPCLPHSFSPITQTDFNLETLWDAINPRTLYNLHLGFKGNPHQAQGNPLFTAITERFNRLKPLAHRLFEPQALWQHFKAKSNHDQIWVYPEASAPVSWDFPRKNGICLADYLRHDTDDFITLMAVTIGKVAGDHTETLFQQGRFTDMLCWHALTVQSAEALAETVHAQLRRMHGDEDSPPDAQSLWDARYTGKRYSFGYAACPDLRGQALFFKLLKPETIGIHLSESMMMNPEASVNALVFYHPAAAYF